MKELVCPRHMCKTPLGKCMEWDIDEITGERVQCNEKSVMSTTLYWCKQCNVPIYEESCPLCGEKGKYIATDIRPVFPEEKMLLAILLGHVNENRYNEITDEAISFVQGYKERYSLEDMFVSFSGGKDSTVTSDIVRRAFSSNKVYHIFGDTTLEFPLTYEYKESCIFRLAR